MIRRTRRPFCLFCRFLVILSVTVLIFPGTSRGQGASGSSTTVVNNNTTGSSGVTAQSKAVGGVAIDSQGILENVQTDALGQLAKLRAEALQKIPAGINVFNDSRKVSLRRLEAAIEESTKSGKPLPDEIRYLAGLQQINYIFVYPEQKDIILVGPGEGWKVDARGNMVGITTGRPVMLLDDLLVALRTAQSAAQGGISCSIDPTPDGLAHYKQLVSVKSSMPAQQLAAKFAEAMGMQRITVEGVPPTSHFAQVLVAADYRMKCLGMNLQAPPKGVKLPSYLQMVPSSSSFISTPRWWMEPKFDPLLRDKDGLAWQLSGASVQTLTEDEFVNAAGERHVADKTNPLAKKWAENMSNQFPALALAEPVFGELRNCMELAVVGALIVKERLPDKAGYSLPVLMTSQDLKPDELNAPKQVPSIPSMVQRSRGAIISISGGVAINSWGIADNTRQTDSVASIRAKAAPSNDSIWWWN
jgi:hypothetical protein